MIYTFSPGVNTSFSSQLNNNFAAACGTSNSVLTPTELNLSSSWSSQDTTITLSGTKTYSIPANTVKSYIEVIVTYQSVIENSGGNNSFDCTAYVNLDIASAIVGSTSYTSLINNPKLNYSRAVGSSTYGGTYDYSSACSTIDYYIYPSAAEITTGLNIKFDSYLYTKPNSTSVGHGSCNLVINQIVLRVY